DGLGVTDLQGPEGGWSLGTRRTLIATFQDRGRGEREHVMTPSPASGTIVPCRQGEFDGLPLWQDDVEGSHDARFELDTTLHVPEPEGWLDFSSVLPTVEILQPRELADNEAEVRRDGGHNAGRYRGDARRRAAGVGPRIRRVSARLAQLGRI